MGEEIQLIVAEHRSPPGWPVSRHHAARQKPATAEINLWTGTAFGREMLAERQAI
jgi:hypothetical protein